MSSEIPAVAEIDNNDESEQFIEVALYDTQFTSTVLRVTSITLTSDLIEVIVGKTDIIPDEQPFFTLVLVVTGINDSKYRTVRHCLRTLQSDECIANVLQQFSEKQSQRYRFTETSSRWFFKDTRTLPIDLGDNGEVIGEESTSDDEDEMTLNDLSYIMQADRKGYLLKRSSKDPNLWRKRYCILTDKLWCINDRLRQPKATGLRLSSILVNNVSNELHCPNVIAVHSNHGVHTFLAASSVEQQLWLEDINQRTALMSDNDAISMAEMIICDEESARYQRMQRGVSNFLDSTPFQSCFFLDNSSSNNSISLNSNKNTQELDNTKKHSNFTEQPSKQNPKLISSPEKERRTNRIVITINASNNGLMLPQRDYIPPPRYLSLVHQLHTKNQHAADILSFVQAVHGYKELFRHDLTASIRTQWSAVFRILYDHLMPQLKRLRLQRQTGFDQLCGTHVVDKYASVSSSSANQNHDVQSGKTDCTSDDDTEMEGNRTVKKSSSSSSSSSLHDTKTKDSMNIRNTFQDANSSWRTVLDLWSVPIEVWIKLCQSISSRVQRCDPRDARDHYNHQRAKIIKLNHEKKKRLVRPTPVGKLGPVPLSAVSSRFAKTPTVGNESSGSIGDLFGIDRMNSQPSSATVAAAASSTQGFWSWTSRALGLTVIDEDEGIDDNNGQNSPLVPSIPSSSSVSNGLKGSVGGTSTTNNLHLYHDKDMTNESSSASTSHGTYIILTITQSQCDTCSSKDMHTIANSDHSGDSSMNPSRASSPLPVGTNSTSTIPSLSMTGKNNTTTSFAPLPTQPSSDMQSTFMEVSYHVANATLRPESNLFDELIEQLKVAVDNA